MTSPRPRQGRDDAVQALARGNAAGLPPARSPGTVDRTANRGTDRLATNGASPVCRRGRTAIEGTIQCIPLREVLLNARTGFASTLMVLTLTTVACSPNAGESLEANKRLILRVHGELWSEGNFAALDELVAPDFLGHAPIGSDWVGSQGLRERIEAHRTTFPDWKEEVDMVLAEGDLVAVRFTSTGTDEGGFRGAAASGRSVEIQEFGIYRIANGRVVEQWVLPDLLGLHQQLGLIPARSVGDESDRGTAAAQATGPR